MDAENQKSDSGREHHKRAQLFNTAETRVLNDCLQKYIECFLSDNKKSYVYGFLVATIGRSTSKVCAEVEAVFRRKTVVPRTARYSEGTH